jgi:hypothetical protein
MMTTRVTGKVEEIFSYARPEEVETRDEAEAREEAKAGRNNKAKKRNKTETKQR